MLSVQPGGGLNRDEELGTIRSAPEALAGVRHRKQVRLVEGQFGADLVIKLVTRAAHAGAERVATLNHEPRDDPVENRAVVQWARCLLALVGPLTLTASQAREVLDRLRSLGREQLYVDITFVGVNYSFHKSIFPLIEPILASKTSARWHRPLCTTRFYVGPIGFQMKGKVKHMDQGNLKHIASDVLEVVAETATKAAHAATKAASVAAEAGEKAVEAGKASIETATPIVEKVVEDAGEEAKKLADKTAQVVKDTTDKGVDASKAGIEALAAVGADVLADVEKHARDHKPAKKKHRGRSFCRWSLALAGVGAVAYVMWRRSRPVEDPWAEEYWVDLQSNVDLDDVPNESAQAKAEEAVAKAEDVAEAIAEAVEEAVEEATKDN